MIVKAAVPTIVGMDVHSIVGNEVPLVVERKVQINVKCELLLPPPEVPVVVKPEVTKMSNQTFLSFTTKKWKLVVYR